MNIFSMTAGGVLGKPYKYLLFFLRNNLYLKKTFLFVVKFDGKIEKMNTS